MQLLLRPRVSLPLPPTGALVVMMVYYIYIYIYPQHQLFQIFTQSIDAIDVTSVTLRGGINKKKTVFFLLSVKRGRGGLGQSKKKVIRKYSDFFD